MGKFWVPTELMETVISPTAKLLVVQLCRSAPGKTTEEPWDYTHGQLATAIGVKERSIRLALVELKALSMVVWSRSSKGIGRSRPNVYTVLPVASWKAEAFRTGNVPALDESRHPACGAGSERRHPAAESATPGSERPETRHVVPTPGSTAPGRKAPGREHTPAADAAVSVLPAGFMEFWQQYPAKEGKSKALAAWTKLNPSEALVAQIMAGLAVWHVSGRWNRGFVVLPARWLAERRWEDDPAPPGPPLSDRTLALMAVGQRFVERHEHDEPPQEKWGPRPAPSWQERHALEAKYWELYPTLSADRVSRLAEQHLRWRDDPPGWDLSPLVAWLESVTGQTIDCKEWTITLERTGSPVEEAAAGNAELVVVTTHEGKLKSGKR